MKKTIYFLFRWAIVPLLLLICTFSYAQQPGAQIKINNDSLWDSKNYYFDVWLRAKDVNGTTSFNLEGFQAGFQSYLKYVKVGTATVSIVPGSSQFGTNPPQQPTVVLLKPIATTNPLYIQLNPTALTTNGMTFSDSTNDPLHNGGWLRACTIKISDTASFLQAPMNVYYSPNITYPNAVFANYYLSSVFTSAQIPSDTINYMVNPKLNYPITKFNVTGTGSYVTGGVSVGLNGSEIGCAYKLQKYGVTIAGLQEIAGTGSAISWPSRDSGTYTVVGRRIATYERDTLMLGNAIVTIALQPGAAGVINGLSTVCQGQSNVTYTTNHITNADSTIWTYSGTGITMTRINDTTMKINYLTNATSGNLTIYGKNALGNGTSTTVAITVNVLPSAAGTITGLSTTNTLTTATYYVPQISNATSYTWNYTGQGVTYTSSTTGDSVVLTFTLSATPGNLTVQGTNACGNGVISQTFYINVIAVPAAAGTIVGPSGSCPGINNLTYSVPPILGVVSDSTGYIWNYTGTGATLKKSLTGDTVYINFALNATAGNLTVQGHNLIGNGTVSPNYAIAINPFPVAAGTITGTVKPCLNVATAYTVPAIANATSYTWTAPSGATGTSLTNTINLTFTTAGIGTITVKGLNACGVGATSSYIDTAISVPTITSDTVKGLTLVCQGSTNVLYSLSSLITGTTPGSGATSYVWTLPSGVYMVGTTQSTDTTASDSIKVQFSNSTGANGFIKVNGRNVCGIGSPWQSGVTISPLPGTPSSILGTTTICQKDSSVYKINLIPNATTYTWTVPTGYSTSNQGLSATIDSIKIKYLTTAANGSITIYGSNSCGNGPTATLPIIVNPVPGVAGTMTGVANVCFGQNGVIYWVHKVSTATSYSWTYPTGWTVVGNNTDSTITFNVGNGALSGTISCAPVNACGQANASTFGVTVSTLPGAAGAISGPTTACGGATGVVYTLPAITGATSYSWTLPSGATGGSSSNTIFVSYTSATQSGNITVSGVSFCGNGTSSSLAVVVGQVPIFDTVNHNDSIHCLTTLNGDTATCPGTTRTFWIHPAAGATTYSWSYPFGWTPVGPTNNDTITLTLTAGAITGNISVEGDNACGNGLPKYRKITVNSLPLLSNTITGPFQGCSNLGDTVTFSITSKITWATSAVWGTPAGFTQISASDTNFKAKLTSTATSGYITVYGINQCFAQTGQTGPTNQKYFTVLTVPSAASSISGISSSCKGVVNVYSVPQISGAATYNWSYSGTSDSAKTVNNQYYEYFGTNSTSGNLTVSGSNVCGTGPASPAFPITLITVPTGIGSVIAGANSNPACQGAIATYSVNPIASATGYTWNVAPSLGTIISGQGTSSITVQILGNAFQGGVYCTPTNSCGNGAPSPTLNVTITPLPSAAGVITGPLTTCVGTTGLVYTVPSISGATSYSWSCGPLNSFTGTASSTTNSVTLTAGTILGIDTIKVKGVNACGSGNQFNLLVNVMTVPTAPVITKINGTEQQGAIVFYSAVPFTSGYTYTWTVTGGNMITPTPTSNVGDTLQAKFKDSFAIIGYQIHVVAHNQCGDSPMANYSVPPKNGINEIIGNLSYHIYPNPTNGILNIEIDGINENIEMSIINPQGSVIKTESISRHNAMFKKEIDMSAYARGIYFIRIISKDFVRVEKIVVQ